MIDAVYLEKLYHSYSAKMYSVCYKYSGDESLCADIVQEIFLTIWERRETLQILQPERYLIRASKLKLLEHYRNSHRRMELYQRIIQTIDFEINNPENDIVIKELTTLFNRQVEELPKKQRAVFRLKHEKNYDNSQIARELNISERTVDNYISFTSQKLKEFIRTGLRLFL